MTYRVVVSDRASQQLREAYLWYATRSEIAGRRWYNGISKAIESLRHSPLRCPIARERPKFPIEIREVAYGRHRNFRIVFTIRDDVVFVVCVRHASRDDLSEADIF
jgi:plasmid stabilization system protein ParE